VSEPSSSAQGRTDSEDGTAKVRELVDRARLAMLTTMTPEGRHVSRPMALQDTEFDGDLWFFTYDDSDKVRQVAQHPEVNVAFSNEKNSEWTSVAGRAELVRDRAKAEELWSKPLETWFPDGLETPGLALLKVHADTAEYWDASQSRVKKVLGMVRAIRQDDPDQFPSENRTVEL
jgi:general stress protein 26